MQQPATFLFSHSPDAPKFTIVGVTDAYLKAAYTHRVNIIGKTLFDVFSNNPQWADATGLQNLSGSLYVVDHKQEHRMKDQRMMSSTARKELLSTSATKYAVKEAYEMSVQGFFEKEHDLKQIGELIHAIYTYWQRCQHPNM